MGSNAYDKQLGKELSKYVFDPLGFVYFAYPWGQSGSMLELQDGPDVWQQEVLGDIGELCTKQVQGDYGNVIQYAIKAGRGPGKTALLAWLMHWFLTSRPYSSNGVITANTKVQLETKSWRELAKWWAVSVHKDWFEHNASKFFYKLDSKTRFITPIVWSKERPQSIAGLHEEYVLTIFDEASDIDDIIWETVEGGMTDPNCLWIVAGNPTRNDGRFKQCWGDFAHRWVTKTVDSRTSKRADKNKIREWEEDYGEDSDFFRVWVKGDFPNASVSQFISEELAKGAVNKRLERGDFVGYPVLMGIDVARQGNNRNVIYTRQGYKTLDLFKIHGRIENTMEMVGYVTQKMMEWKPRYIFIDVGMGYALIDRLRQLGHRNIIEVNFGKKAGEENKYANKRAEMWGLMKKWLFEGGQIPDNSDLVGGLTAINAGEDKKSRLLLQSKRDIPDSVSIDEADALACTFAFPVDIDFSELRTPAQVMIDRVEGRDMYFNQNSYLRG